MDKNDGNKYRIVARTLNTFSADYIVVYANADVDMVGLSNYKDSDIIALEDGNNILNILGSLKVGCV